MTTGRSRVAEPAAERGFVLLALMGAIGAACLGLVLVAQRFVPDPAERQLRVTRNLEAGQRLVAAQFLRAGVFPRRIGDVETGGEVVDDRWSYDPYGRGVQLRYARTASGVQLTSRGPDLRLNTADDRRVTVGAEALVRVRQRPRLRLVRAVYVRELLTAIDAAGTAGAASVTAAQVVRQYALAQRRWLTATAAERVVLQATMDGAAANLTALLAGTTYTAPVSVTGAGGFMARLGLGDARAFDGARRRYQLHPVLGVVAVGYDRVRGTDDDM